MYYRYKLSHMSTEYLHVKTTPQMPVRIAVRMSMSIPGMHNHLESSIKTEVLECRTISKLS